MINSRYYGQARIQTPDGVQARNVLILSPYIQTSESTSSIDYDHSLVADLQSMEFDYKSQLEEMLQSVDSTQYKTFMEYAHKSSFRNGDNVLQWLHQTKSIRKVNAKEVNIVMLDQAGNPVVIPVVDVNKHIKAENEKNTVESTYTDPSTTNSSKLKPALIEGMETDYDAPQEQNLNESVSPYEVQSDLPSTDIPSNIDLSELNSEPVIPENFVDSTFNDEQSQTEVSKTDPILAKLESLEEQIKSSKTTEKKGKKSDDSFIIRLMNKYQLTETEVVKALESAGKRKEKRLNKDK